jgi:hypothetical protein
MQAEEKVLPSLLYNITMVSLLRTEYTYTRFMFFTVTLRIPDGFAVKDNAVQLANISIK